MFKMVRANSIVASSDAVTSALGPTFGFRTFAMIFDRLPSQCDLPCCSYHLQSSRKIHICLHRRLGRPLVGDWVRQNFDIGLLVARAHSIATVHWCSRTRNSCRAESV